MGTRVTFKSEDVRLLFEGLNRLLAGRGYRRRGTTWYLDTREFIRVFTFDPGPLTWTNFAVGIYLHALDNVDDPTVWDSIRPRRCRATHPQIEDCAVSINLRYLVEDRAEFDKLTKFLARNVSGLEAVPRIIQLVSEIALPLLESFRTVDDIRKAVHSGCRCKSDLKIRESAKEILSCI